MRALYLIPFLALAACATPQQQCISSASRNLSTVEKLIAQTRGNLARGFGVETKTKLVEAKQVCGRTPNGKKIFCDIPVTEQERVPVALDLKAEQAKLDSLLKRRAELLRAREARIKQCIALHPK